MLIAERQSRLAELLSRRGVCGLNTLAAELDVSPSTVRRDLEAMERRGVLQRTHGGAIWVGEAKGASAVPYAFDQQTRFQRDAKRQIAKSAVRLVTPGQTLLLDGGTTTFYFAQELLGRPMQLVTNSLPIANLFLDDEKVELVLAGGLLYPRYGVFLGPMAENSLAAVHTQTVFFSVAGIHEGTLYNQNVLLVQSQRQMIEHTRQVVLLADSTKFGQQALARLCDLSEVDVVVSDWNLSQTHQQQVRDAGCELILAQESVAGK